ncbi:MAG: patatin family protein [Deltaproteobacteria bacterium]|nr:patatin family protein [Deltaproteobacteria bacterium]
MENFLEKTGLILEGGGLRGIYSSGVLRFFMERGLFFPYVVGVSMGACNAANYLSRQMDRNRIVNIDFVKDHRYLSRRRWFFKGELFGMDFIFDTIPNHLVPFDYARFFAAGEKFWVGTTDCRSGRPLYFEKSQLGNDLMTVLRASCSLPFISKTVSFQGRHLMDGGVADPIPIYKSMVDGNTRHILILTRPRGYRKNPIPLQKILLLRYARFPGLCQALARRYLRYNRVMDYIEALETNGTVFVLRPSAPLKTKRAEKNQGRLMQSFEQGYKDAASSFPSLIGFLRKPEKMIVPFRFPGEMTGSFVTHSGF